MGRIRWTLAKWTLAKWTLAGLALAVGLVPAGASAAAKPKSLSIAVVTFFSGSGGVVGGPSVNSARLTIDDINHAGGVDGVPIVARYVDESGGPTKNVAEFRSLAPDVAAIIGYVSSGDCLAVAPVADELKRLTIFSDCTTNALFEGHSYQWVFRTQPPASTNALAMALYIAKTHPHLKSIAGINQDYAFGRDEWKYFSEAMGVLEPGIKVGPSLFPALFSGHYTSEISRLLGASPALIYSSLWGGDVVALIQQGQAQGMFQSSLVALSLGTQGGIEGLKALPDNVIVGSENSYLLHPGKIADSQLAGFVDTYRKRFGEYPASTYPYTVRRSILTLWDAYLAAISKNDGKWPSDSEAAKALVGLKVKTLLGTMEMRSDHQGTFEERVGISVHSSDYPFAVFNKIVIFPADMIMPPVGETAEKWIATLTPKMLDAVPAPHQY
ncbi:MAG: ABC transporter substrate-binding protein [Acetobacteraceae bacterium]